MKDGGMQEAMIEWLAEHIKLYAEKNSIKPENYIFPILGLKMDAYRMRNQGYLHIISEERDGTIFIQLTEKGLAKAC